MPKLTAAVAATLKKRPLQNSQLNQDEKVPIPKGVAIAASFPMDDAHQFIRQIRLEGDLSSAGLKAGQIWYVFTQEWLQNGGILGLQKTAIAPASASEKKVLTTLVKGSSMVDRPTLKDGDYHLIVVDDESKPTSKMTCWNAKGQLQWTKDCLARGQYDDWSAYAGDTPPGVYTIGECWISDPNDAVTCKPYGIHCFDLVSEIKGEIGLGREGICLHGGGTALGFDGCNDDYQELVPTFGCIRMHNADLRDVIYPLWKKTRDSKNSIWVSVHQL